MIAGIIAGEVMESGKSHGWQGSLEELSQVEKPFLLQHLLRERLCRRMGVEASAIV